MDRQLIDYLPDILKKYKNFIELARVEQPQIEALWDACESLLDEKFLDTQSEVGAAKWESILDFKPKSTDSLEVRTFRIRGKLVEDLPYTERTFCRFLSTLCGENGYTYNLDVDNYHFTIKVALFNKALRDEVESLAERVVPQNIILEIDLLYNTHGKIKKAGLTHRDLSNLTHRQIREEPLPKKGE